MPTITKQQLEMYYPNGWRPNEHFLLKPFFMQPSLPINKKWRFIYNTMPYWDDPQPCDCKNCLHTKNCKQCLKTFRFIMREQHWNLCLTSKQREKYSLGVVNEYKAKLIAFRSAQRFVSGMDKIKGTNWQRGTISHLCPCFKKLYSPSSLRDINWDNEFINKRTGALTVKFVETPRKVVIDTEEE